MTDEHVEPIPEEAPQAEESPDIGPELAVLSDVAEVLGEAEARVPESAGTQPGDLLARLEASVQESNRIARERERIIDRLHEENQALRAGELEKAMLPLLRDLVRLYDDLTRTLEAYAGRETLTLEEARRDLEMTRDGVVDALYRQGVERYEAEPGTPFDSREHRVLGAKDTPEATLNRTIARVLRPGFRGEHKLVRALEAEVYRHVPTEPVN